MLLFGSARRGKRKKALVFSTVGFQFLLCVYLHGGDEDNLVSLSSCMALNDSSAFID